MNFKLKRGAIPEELPDLELNEIKEKLSESEKESKSRMFSNSQSQEEMIRDVKEKLSEIKGGGTPTLITKSPNPAEKNDPKIKDSFFNEILKNIEGEMSDLKKLESLYDHKLMPKDVVSEMREYWEKQKPGQIIEIAGKKFKEDLTKKIDQLGILEKEWRQISLQLIEKEEEIRKEEKELKLILVEFVNACKEKLKNKKE
jgi:hypothetical protein